jgi:hypothetical protein
MLWNLFAHWTVGLPVAYILAFPYGFGAAGLWWGLSIGLIACGAALVVVWWSRSDAVLHLLSSTAGGAMAQQKEPPRPHGDPLAQEIVESNQAQRQTDAPGDAVSGEQPERLTRPNIAANDRAEGRGSTANGVPAADEDDGQQRRKQYEGGAELVSKID